MAQRTIELLIGRLITDERFREEFIAAPEMTLNDLCALGLELSATEIAALAETDSSLWIRAANELDPRLQKINLKGWDWYGAPRTRSTASRSQTGRDRGRRLRGTPCRAEAGE